jgi:hypothetical protein
MGKASFCSFRVEMEGEAGVLRPIWQRFEQMTLRPGG